jgi:hypothetical protein
VLAAAASSADIAAAHSPPEIARIVWKSERELVLVTNRGLMFGSALGPTAPGPEHAEFRLLCNEALRINTSEVPQIAFRADGALLAATSNGLFVTRDEGCSWTPLAPLVDMFVPALVQLPGAPNTLIAATFGPGQSALRITRDGGESWSVLSSLSDRDYTRSLLVGPGDPALLYATGTAFDDPPNPRETQYIARSNDGGKSWQRQAVALPEGELALLLLAVNPARGDELLVRAMSASPGFVSERLLHSVDGGRSFRTAHTLLSFAAATFAPDGSAAWIASREGIFRTGVERDAFVRVGVADRITCIEFRDDKLWACGHYTGVDPERDGVGNAAPASALFDPFLDFREVAKPVACPSGTALAGICNAPWRDFHDEVVRPFEAMPEDAGSAPLARDDEPAAAPDETDAAAGAPLVSSAEDAAHGSDAGAARPRRATGCAVSAPSPTGGASGWASALLLCLFARGSQLATRRLYIGMASRWDRRSQPRTMR